MVMAETSTFGTFSGRNILAEMSVAETSVAEISYIRFKTKCSLNLLESFDF